MTAYQSYRLRVGVTMGKALDEFIESLQGELRVGGGATLDELFNLALAIQEDLATPPSPISRKGNI